MTTWVPLTRVSYKNFKNQSLKSLNKNRSLGRFCTVCKLHRHVVARNWFIFLFFFYFLENKKKIHKDPLLIIMVLQLRNMRSNHETNHKTPSGCWRPVTVWISWKCRSIYKLDELNCPLLPLVPLYCHLSQCLSYKL